MDTKLKIFCTLVETQSFTRTSKIVHISQPAVTLQIQALEEFFETKLFDKTEGKITLTKAGQVLYDEAKHILNHHKVIEKAINEITGQMKGAVTLGASTSVGNYILPSVISKFKKLHPKIKIKMLVDNTERIEELLLSGFIDFGVIAGTSSKRPVTSESLMSDELVLVVPPKHPLTRKRSVSILDLTREPFILREEGSGSRNAVETFLKNNGLSQRDLHIALVLGSTKSIKTTVEEGTGIALISKWAVKNELEDGRLKIVNVKEGRIPRTLSLILSKKRNLSHADKEFILFIKNYPYDSF